MTNDWILDVLDDLTSYARKNDLQALAEQLDGAVVVARTEMGHKVVATGMACRDAGASGTLHRAHAACGNAG